MYVSHCPATPGFDGDRLRPAATRLQGKPENLKVLWECGKQGLEEILDAQRALEKLSSVQSDPLVAEYHAVGTIPQIERGLALIAKSGRCLRYVPAIADKLRQHYAMDLLLDGLSFVVTFSLDAPSEAQASALPVEKSMMLHGLYAADSTTNVLNVIGNMWAETARTMVISALTMQSEQIEVTI
ncbi:hypothetical protein ACUHMQ_15750 [Chitinimonas sp. PSY-7]|uniref:hypothetical protein n=1 Tax=Chitinimonas sp. PSY-7 TaxID=3459088 RepID=UPI0040403286